MKPLRLAAISLAGLCSASVLDPGDALACGGTFCDVGPTAMPVDQTGENILFVMDGETVEAHVQIQYTGDPARFAWVVPMPAVPDVRVGSQLLFQGLLAGTVPTFNFFTQRDSCGSVNDGGLSIGTGGTGNSAGAGGGPGSGPEVVFEATVGAFEVVVLQGGTADEVSDWLTDNGYQTIPSAPAILGDYVAQGFVFVAIKLTAGAGIDEIHPLVFRYTGNEPCVPLKLTAVAAQENMGVRAFFLGDDRVYPTNYKHVELNPARIDWLTRAGNYNTVVTRAVDSPVAGGHAFVTEYAGASAVVSPFTVFSDGWSGSPFATIAPERVIDVLGQQGLASCFDQFFCQFSHPLLAPLLTQYLPVPEGLSPAQFYSCLDCYADRIDLGVWDGPAFAAAFEERIVEPGAHARELLETWPYLTRLFTTISPAEMTEDPLFHPRPDLSEPVTNRFNANQRVTCCGDSAMTLPDSRQVALDGSGTWPPFSSAMPWAEKIVEVPLSGPAITLVDNTEQINQQLSAWNQARGWPPSACPAAGGGGGAPGTGSGGTSARAGAATLDDDTLHPAGSSGCGCALPGERAALGGYLTLAAAAVSLFRIRSRRRRSCAIRV